jgi:hypothetical protein
VKGKMMSDSFEKPKDPTQQVITFGKHQGLTVAELLHNHKSYVEWLTGQSWLAERFSDLHAALLSRGAPTDETPEHNKIQARFLDPLFCDAFISLSRRYIIEDRRPLKYKVSFERKGIDVLINYWTRDRESFSDPTDFTGLEIKPSIGDEFPTVLRQMERLGVKICVAEHYTGRGTSEPIVKKIFESNGYTLIFLRDIEAEMLNLRASPRN